MPYDYQIVPSLSKQISTKHLLTRLLDLADHLSALDQSSVSTGTYERIAADLASKKLLHHSNVSVQALTCCCLADIFRIFAPDAPYSEPDISTIFKAFFHQLSLAWDQRNPDFPQQSYLLTRLVEVRSIILIVDLPDASDLISNLFDTIYTLAAKGFPLKLEHLAADVLAEVVAEAGQPSKHVVDLVFQKLTNDASLLTTESSNISNPGFVFSVAVCEANIDKMSRLLAQLYSETLDESVRAKDAPETSKKSLFKALEKIHLWSVLIWRHVPDLLTPVMGLINDELSSDSDRIRSLATSTIGSMLATSSEPSRPASINSTLSQFVSLHRMTWSNWLKKSLDISPVVRSTWVEQLPDIFASSSATSEMLNELRLGFSKCLLDSNEKVRFSACKAIESTPFPIFTKKLCTKPILDTLFLLLRERDEEIRNRVIRTLSYVYDNYMRCVQDREVVDFGNLQPEDIQVIEKLIVEDFPNHLLHLNYINLPSITTAVDIELFENILPFQSSTQKRVRRLCRFFQVLDSKSRSAFLAIATRQQKYAHAVNKFVELSKGSQEEDKENVEYLESSKSHNADTINKAQKIFSWLSAALPEKLNGYATYEKLFFLNNKRVMKLLSNCVSELLDYKTIKNSIKELIIKLSDTKTVKLDQKKGALTREELISSVKILLYRASPIMFNQSNIAELIAIAKDPSSDFWRLSNDLLELVSTTAPKAITDHVKNLAENFVLRDDADASDQHCSLLRLIHRSLKTSLGEYPEDPRFVDKLLRLAYRGSPLQAKYAVKVLGQHEHKEHYLTEVTDKILPLRCDDMFFATHLASIAEVALILPIVIEGSTNEINRVVTEEVLRKNRCVAESAKDWISDAELVEKHSDYAPLNEKLSAIRYIVNRLRALGKSGKLSESSEATQLVSKPIKLLSMVLVAHGELVKNLTPTPEAYKSRLQLAAALAILKISKLACFNSIVDATIILRAERIVFNLKIEARRGFAQKLQRYLSSFVLSERFLHINFLFGHEPNSDLKEEVATWVRSFHHRTSVKGNLMVEMSLSRLIHAISHDDRFKNFFTDDATEQDHIQGFEYALGYLSLYLHTVANLENISLLYYVASRVKQYKDALVEPEIYKKDELPSEAINLYRVAELCQLMLKHHSDQKGWNLQTWPGKLKLANDIFALMDDMDEANRIVSKVYISDSEQVELMHYLKMGRGGNGSKRKAPLATTATKKPKRAPKARKSPKKKTVSEPVLIRKSTRARKQVKYAEEASEGSDEGQEQSEDEDSYDEDQDD